jgi:hypothetical protein
MHKYSHSGGGGHILLEKLHSRCAQASNQIWRLHNLKPVPDGHLPKRVAPQQICASAAANVNSKRSVEAHKAAPSCTRQARNQVRHQCASTCARVVHVRQMRSGAHTTANRFGAVTNQKKLCHSKAVQMGWQTSTPNVQLKFVRSVRREHIRPPANPETPTSRTHTKTTPAMVAQGLCHLLLLHHQMFSGKTGCAKPGP